MSHFKRYGDSERQALPDGRRPGVIERLRLTRDAAGIRMVPYKHLWNYTFKKGKSNCEGAKQLRGKL